MRTLAAQLGVADVVDHVPTMEGDPNDRPGYTARGRLYAIGYMRGLLEAARDESRQRSMPGTTVEAPA
jgi:D-mannonate dehydratase